MSTRDDLMRSMDVSGLRRNVEQQLAREPGPGVDPCDLALSSLFPLLSRSEVVKARVKAEGMSLPRMLDGDQGFADAFDRMSDDASDAWRAYKKTCVRHRSQW